MKRANGFRNLLWLAAAMLALGCSLVTGAIPAAYKQEAIRDLNAFLPPSNTPFLPGRVNLTPTVFPPTSSRQAEP